MKKYIMPKVQVIVLSHVSHLLSGSGESIGSTSQDNNSALGHGSDYDDEW